MSNFRPKNRESGACANVCFKVTLFATYYEIVTMNRRTTIKDIAAQLGVSHSTVSRALRGDKRISSTTVENVRRVAERIGYRPNILACGLVHNRTSLIGILTSNVRGSFFADVIDGAQSVLDKRRYSILLCCSHKNPAAERAHLETLIDKQVEGIILLPVTSCGTNSRVIRQAQDLHIPIVIVGTRKKEVNAPMIGTDNEQGGYLAARHLLDLGHRRIIYITPSKEDLHSERHRFGLENAQRYRGYLRAMKDFGLDSEISTIEIDPDVQDMTPLRDILKKKNAPTAFFAYSDRLAISAMQASLSWGYRVPTDLSFVGFDDIDFASLVYPPLTSIAQPKLDMGRFAAKKILNQIEGLPEDDLTCTPELRKRDSSGPAPK